MTDTPDRRKEQPRARRRGRRLALWLLAAAFVVLGVGSLIDLLRVRSDIDHGHDRLDDLTIEDIRRESISGLLDAASDDFASAADRASNSPFLRFTATLPGVGSQVNALRDLTSAADELGREIAVSGHRIDDALGDAGNNGEGRVRVFDVVLAELDRLQRIAGEIELGAEGYLVRPLASARHEVATSLDEVPERLRPLRRQVTAVRALLTGPSNLLLLIGNNAEMRSMAMPLTAAQLHFTDGEMDLSDITPAGIRVLITTADGGLNAGPALERLREPYPEWLVGVNILATSVVPSFPATAPLYSGVAESAENWQTNGVIFIDILAVAPLLDIVGPVTIDGVTYTADNAAQLILNEPYREYATTSVRDERREAASVVAGAVFTAIRERPVDVLDLVASLQESAEGRHFMAWSEDPVLEGMFWELGISGLVTPAHTLITFQNTGANKLDYYLTGDIDLTTRALQTGRREVRVEATVTNPSVADLTPYLAGPLKDGSHQFMFMMQLPANATNLYIEDAQVTEYGFDGTSQVIGARFLVPPGDSLTVQASYQLPGSDRAILVVPSARINPVTWTHDGQSYTDDRPFSIRLSEFPASELQQREQTAATVAGLVGLAGAVVLLVGYRRWDHAGRPVVSRQMSLDRTTGGVLALLALVVAVLAITVI